jgi:hypothetical protein
VTGLFLKAIRTETKYDDACFDVTLDAGSSLSYFKISPMYKNRTEGGKVFQEDEIKLQSETIADYLIHRTHLQQPLVSSFGSVYEKQQKLKLIFIIKMNLTAQIS